MADETPNAPPPGNPATAPRARNWDAFAAIVASLVGLLALLVAGYTAHIQREQVRAEVWPYLIGGFTSVDSELMWINKGVGPAIVKSVQLRVDGQPRREWREVFDALGFEASGWRQSFLNGNVVSPGETVAWLRFADRGDFDRFMALGQAHGLGVELCYCSTLGDCWQTRWNQSSREAIAECRAVPAGHQFGD
ncbi:MAG: hypothetical protein J0H15_05780 [Xanthomonadales bacterium]|nr:hypothetical protein [Xanthomonadales bacterium]